MEKVCSNCGCSKEVNKENFRKCKYASGVEYFRAICNRCEKEKNRQYARAHKDERKKYAREFRKINPTYVKSWKTDNKDVIREQEKLRRMVDINFRLKKNVSRAIGHAIVKRGNSAIKYLPYTMNELKIHLEAQFDENMTWENYGTYWHIDHIVPHSTFAYKSMEDTEFKECWALNNLRPLEANQNRLDGSTRVRHKRG